MIKCGILSNSTRRSKLHAVTDCPFFIGRYECVISMGFFDSVHQSIVSADGSYVWATFTNFGKQVTSKP